jgi:hypothetical protein
MCGSIEVLILPITQPRSVPLSGISIKIDIPAHKRKAAQRGAAKVPTYDDQL